MSTSRDRLKEVRGVVEFPRLMARVQKLRNAPRGDGRIVLLFPGLGANDLSLVPLRRFLVSIGHDARGWGLGVNNADFGTIGSRSQALVRRLAEESGRPVDIVGWSLGGVFAREAARQLPGSVRRIVTFGTPLHGPRSTATSDRFTEEETREIEAMIARRRDRPVTAPITVVYSRNDGVVDWRSCVDRHSPDVENVEITSSHFTMGLDPDLWQIIAHRLRP